MFGIYIYSIFLRIIFIIFFNLVIYCNTNYFFYWSTLGIKESYGIKPSLIQKLFDLEKIAI